jgi:hypothetical protein
MNTSTIQDYINGNESSFEKKKAPENESEK